MPHKPKAQARSAMPRLNSLSLMWDLALVNSTLAVLARLRPLASDSSKFVQAWRWVLTLETSLSWCKPYSDRVSSSLSVKDDEDETKMIMSRAAKVAAVKHMRQVLAKFKPLASNSKKLEQACMSVPTLETNLSWRKPYSDSVSSSLQVKLL